MKSNINSADRLRELLLLTLMGVLMYISQVLMAGLPNIELVSLLIILVARSFGFRSLISVYIFAGCEILTYGISIWVINYLYVWAVLAIIIILLKKVDNAVVYALVSGLFGLVFGTLCSVPYFFTVGVAGGFSYIINGFWFDLLHSIGNFVLALILYRPLTKAMNAALKAYNKR